MANVLVIKGSPRAGGNTDALADEAIAGATEAGHNVTELRLREHKFAGCINCGRCLADGVCRVMDDMQEIYKLLDTHEHFILAAPMFFMGLPWNVKSLIDRCQAYWVRKYVLKTGVGRVQPGGNAVALLVGGTRFKTLFRSPRIVLGAWCAVLEMELHLGLTLRGIDAPGDVRKHGDTLAKARELGEHIASLQAT